MTTNQVNEILVFGRNDNALPPALLKAHFILCISKAEVSKCSGVELAQDSRRLSLERRREIRITFGCRPNPSNHNQLIKDLINDLPPTVDQFPSSAFP